MDLKNLTQEERSELSLIDVAHFILEQRKETILFPELVKEIQTFLGLKDAEIRERLVQFYTDMNIDGNFISLGNNTWGLRAWYPMDAIDEEVQTQTTPKKKRKSDDDDEDEEILDVDVDYDDEEVVEELGEEEITLADVLLDEDEDDDDHLPDGIEGDLATVEDDYTDGDYTEDPEDK
ncbi:DNA-directed RNA polymerase subunit delta [Listeria seeligeri]|uniref:DNA-directed RNA polymerase subunit delta n=1 Tax=Listeria seeligeri TaxID=1640 RepID=UPI0022EC121C|nr:DNA-directed RNA polymerase subunit delta [Listeria seeligeri]